MSTATATELAPIKVGDVFRCTWGYDQTNVDIYEVLEVSASGKTAKVRQVASKAVVADGSYSRVVPVPGVEHPWNGMVLTKRLRVIPDYGNGARWAFRVASYADAYKWDGQPSYETDPRAGH